MKAPLDVQLPRHHHTGTVMVYTVEGKWKYAEHDWVAGARQRRVRDRRIDPYA
jgi:2,4'-dihydroxyacetophenone dioxygenase